MRKYLIIIERGETGYSAYSPDLPGCIATGRTLAITRRRMREAITLHIQGLKEDGERIPRPATLAEQVVVTNAA